MKIVAKNRRAHFDYDILDTVEAGVMLTGPEVKSCRNGNMNLSGAYVSFLGKNIVLKKAKIAPYRYTSDPHYDPERDRELLLKNAEARHLMSKGAEKGIAVIPLEVRAGRYIKILLGLARGRKRFDKRQHIKEREIMRQLQQGRDL